MSTRVIGISALVAVYGLWAIVPQVSYIKSDVSQEIEGRYKKYSEFLNTYLLPKGSWIKGEIEIVDDFQEISKIEDTRYRQLLSKGLSDEESWNSSRIGIVAEDNYMILVRDPVKFPSGRTGTYFRYIWKTPDQETPGAAVLPVLPDGRIMLILNYRHATRSWEFELPRGAKERGETLEETACRELKEETGWIASSVQELGGVTPNTSAEGQRVSVYIAKLERLGLMEKGDEAIQGTYFFTKEEIFEGFKVGYLMVGEKKYNFRGSFEAYALLQAILKDCL